VLVEGPTRDLVVLLVGFGYKELCLRLLWVKQTVICTFLWSGGGACKKVEMLLCDERLSSLR